LEEDDSIVETIIEENKIGTVDLIKNLVALRGPRALFQGADITFLASLVFGSLGFGATELFRRSFTMTFFTDGGGTNSEVILLLAATAATVITSAAASPFELLRVRSMGLIESKPWTAVLGDFLNERTSNRGGKKSKKSVSTPEKSSDFSLKDIKAKDLLPLFAGFPPTVSRELAFAIPKFLAFDIITNVITGFINASADPGSLPIQVGVGAEGLTISAFSGALAGIAGAIVSHPADLILTKTSASEKKQSEDGGGADWRDVVKDLLSKEGGFANLYVGLQPRLVFFFLVIGLQFFLYDYVKVLLQVGSDDLSLVLDVFYAVRQGLVETTGSPLQ
jgi:solute carrier family 25 phosphate transporter 3